MFARSTVRCPNVFQPDPAVQIRSLDADASIGAAQSPRVLTALDEAGVTVIGVDEDDGSLLVRLQDKDAQLGARSLISDTLKDNVREFVVALAQAPTTPKVAQDLGGKPMSLGLDLFGGAHFLLQVNMQDYIAGVVDNSAEGMRDKLIDERIRFLPNRNWVDGQTIGIGFRDEATREDAKAALVDYQDFLVPGARKRRGSDSQVHTHRGQNPCLRRSGHQSKPDQLAQSRQ